MTSTVEWHRFADKRPPLTSVVLVCLGGDSLVFQLVYQGDGKYTDIRWSEVINASDDDVWALQPSPPRRKK